MAQVALENVTKVYPGNIKAVDSIDLTIDDHEFVVLVGPSGCGKSTTLRMIAGLEDITAGTIRIGERTVNGVAPCERNIAMVFQNYALYPNMTVYKNMAFGLMLRRKYAGWENPLTWLLANSQYDRARQERLGIEQRVRETAGVLGIDDLLQRRPKALSGGQRQRVALGRAIVRDPAAFLFDEPLSNLDAKMRVEMRSELKKLHRQLGTTTVYVTHDQEEAMTLGDRVVVMKDGLIQQCASPLEVYARPVNRFVAGFVGVPPMNFISGRIARDDDGLRFESGAMRLRVAERMRSCMSNFADRPVVLGIRPECAEPAAGETKGQTVPLNVSVVEPLGDRMDVSGTVGDACRMVFRIDARTPAKEGHILHMQIDMNRVHFFQPNGDGRNVSLAAAAT